MARKILLADDSVTAQNMGRKILADAGYEVTTVNNGSAALKKVGEQRPDLIVLDVYMPGYSGLEVCQRLKEANETSRVPILLTVGKLEPFKPEEARRVKADGYIVKPFEASELLSALSKLEDKIVPRAESSKPGRFARAAASLDEPRYDRTVADDEDSGWKNRISFPSKKKKEPEVEADADDASIYNPVNKDLRTVIDHRPAAHPPKRTEAEKVDMGALAGAGLPKDVTPEEIAALAAAAARIKGGGDVKAPEPAAETASAPAAETKSQIHEVKHEEVKHEEARHEEGKHEAAPVEVPVAEAAPAATLAETVKEEKADVKEGLPSDVLAGVMATVAGMEAQSDEGKKSDKDENEAAEAVTMAVAPLVAAAAAVGSRWTAVPVALAPEDSSVSLEQEMQKAHAAYAAADGGRASVVVMTPASEPAAETPNPAPVSVSVPDPVAPPAPASESAPVSEAAPVPVEAPVAEAAAMGNLSAVASAATEAVHAAVKQFETVAASYVKQESSEKTEEPAKQEAVTEESPQPVAQGAAPVEAKAEEPAREAAPPERAESSQETSQETRNEETKAEESKIEEARSEESKSEGPEIEASKVDEAKIEELKAEETKIEESKIEEKTSDEAAPAREEHHEAHSESPAGESEPAAKASKSGDNDFSATTAAAWASWRRIREAVGGSASDSSSSESKAEGDGRDEAAMAVAAGAERAPEAANPESDPAIATLVDSVLADLRPKIVEEISRKLGKK